MRTCYVIVTQMTFDGPSNGCRILAVTAALTIQSSIVHGRQYNVVVTPPQIFLCDCAGVRYRRAVVIRVGVSRRHSDSLLCQ